MAGRKQSGRKTHSPKNPKNAGKKGLARESKGKGARKGSQRVTPPTSADEAFGGTPPLQ